LNSDVLPIGPPEAANRSKEDSMGRKNRLERRAERKAKRADNKEERAARAAAKGHEKRAERLLGRAKELDERSTELAKKAAAAIGATATLHSLNAVGFCFIKVDWTTDGALYTGFKISIASSSPFRSQGKSVTGIKGTELSYDSKTEGDAGLIKNVRYVVKVLGDSSAGEVLIGRCIAEKI
jgi:hypothetical protein